MTEPVLTHRLATHADLPVLKGIMDAAIAELQKPFLNPEQIESSRAMYTDPAYTRRGVGTLIMTLCEEAARAEGFGRTELMATMAGVPLYRACGYEAVDLVSDDRGGAPVPLLRMVKAIG